MRATERGEEAWSVNREPRYTNRIGGGAGPGSLKAVAPAGREQVFITIPANVDQVSLLGEVLDAITPAGHETVVMPGRPVAIVSNMLFEYRPAPPKR